MGKPLTGTSSKKSPMHYSVGALITKKGEILMIERNKEPFGWACVAGHIDEGENKDESLVREVKEESGLDVTHYELLMEEEVTNNTCSRGIDIHYWYVYSCEVIGEFVDNPEEVKKIKWIKIEDLPTLNLEPVWKYWFEKLNII